MRCLVIASFLLTSMLVVVSGGTAASSKESFDLKGEVYPTGFKIELKNAVNRKLTAVKAGTYRIKIEDEATIHNFRLKGPDVNKATSVPRKSELIWTLRLKPGTYTFLCDPHASTMRGTFRVT